MSTTKQALKLINRIYYMNQDSLNEVRVIVAHLTYSQKLCIFNRLVMKGTHPWLTQQIWHLPTQYTKVSMDALAFHDDLDSKVHTKRKKIKTRNSPVVELPNGTFVSTKNYAKKHNF